MIKTGKIISELFRIEMSGDTIVWDIKTTLKFEKGSSRYTTIGEIQNRFSKKAIDLSTIKTLYYAPKVTVPRYKLKDFNKTHGITTIREMSKADGIIISNKSINNLIHYDGGYCLSKPVFLDFLNARKDDITVKKVMIDVLKLINDLNTSISEIVMFDWSALKQFNEYRKNIRLSEFSTSHKAFDVISKADQAFLDLLENPDSNVYPETEILKYMNLGPVIDNIMFNQLRNMLKSEDKANTIVAMEIMSNCNYDQSIVHLCLLFREFYQDTIRSIKEVSHVNFKGLMSYLDLDFRFRSRGIQLDNIIATCIERELLTRNNLNILLDLAHKEFANKGNTDYFKITRIECPADILAKVIEPENAIPDVEVNPVPLSESICIEKSESGDCLMSAQLVEIDLNKPVNFEL